MTDENKEQEIQNEGEGEQKDLRGKWASFGKGLGHSFAGLGKAIVKSAKTGVDRIEGKEGAEDVDLRDSWGEVGKSFGSTGKDLGTAAKGTVDKIDGDEKKADK